jgi:hypothetical protein
MLGTYGLRCIYLTKNLQNAPARIKQMVVMLMLYRERRLVPHGMEHTDVVSEQMPK